MKGRRRKEKRIQGLVLVSRHPGAPQASPSGSFLVRLHDSKHLILQPGLICQAQLVKRRPEEGKWHCPDETAKVLLTDYLVHSAKMLPHSGLWERGFLNSISTNSSEKVRLESWRVGRPHTPQPSPPLAGPARGPHTGSGTDKHVTAAPLCSSGV